jgi:hypothetical protein
MLPETPEIRLTSLSQAKLVVIITETKRNLTETNFTKGC